MNAKLSINLESIETMGEKLYPTNLGIVVLRELIQNSLDANATFIDIELKIDVYVDKNNTATLSVLDNGIGITDYNKYFLQIGNISDQKKENSIGGFGMAKLALLSCTTLEVVSTGGYFNKTMLFNKNESIDESITTDGTMITVTIPNNKIPWQYESYIKSYLKTIKTDVTLIFNEEEIIPYELITFYAKESKEIGFKSEYNNNGSEVVIRVNGLPTIYEYIYGLNGISLIYDITTKSNPNNGDYPLCTNRESLNKSWSGYQDYRSWLENIRASIEEQKELEKVRKAEIMPAYYNNMLLSGGATKQQLKESIKLVKIYKKYVLAVLQIIEADNYNNFKFGITADNNIVAAYVPQVSGFFINPNLTSETDKSKILSLAIHECTHWQGYDEHNKDFANSMTDITAKVFYALQVKQIRL